MFENSALEGIAGHYQWGLMAIERELTASSSMPLNMNSYHNVLKSLTRALVLIHGPRTFSNKAQVYAYSPLSSNLRFRNSCKYAQKCLESRKLVQKFQRKSSARSAGERTRCGDGYEEAVDVVGHGVRRLGPGVHILEGTMNHKCNTHSTKFAPSPSTHFCYESTLTTYGWSCSLCEMRRARAVPHPNCIELALSRPTWHPPPRCDGTSPLRQREGPVIYSRLSSTTKLGSRRPLGPSLVLQQSFSSFSTYCALCITISAPAPLRRLDNANGRLSQCLGRIRGRAGRMTRGGGVGTRCWIGAAAPSGEACGGALRIIRQRRSPSHAAPRAAAPSSYNAYHALFTAIRVPTPSHKPTMPAPPPVDIPFGRPVQDRILRSTEEGLGVGRESQWPRHVCERARWMGRRGRGSKMGARVEKEVSGEERIWDGARYGVDTGVEICARQAITAGGGAGRCPVAHRATCASRYKTVRWTSGVNEVVRMCSRGVGSEKPSGGERRWDGVRCRYWGGDICREWHGSAIPARVTGTGAVGLEAGHRGRVEDLLTLTASTPPPSHHPLSHTTVPCAPPHHGMWAGSRTIRASAPRRRPRHHRQRGTDDSADTTASGRASVAEEGGRRKARERKGGPQRAREAPRRARTAPMTRCGRRHSPSMALTHPQSATSPFRSAVRAVRRGKPPPHHHVSTPPRCTQVQPDATSARTRGARWPRSSLPHCAAMPALAAACPPLPPSALELTDAEQWRATGAGQRRAMDDAA
ncbi:hypothetical protein BJ912DRAFT_1042423 [Pholiota molesta]|nr:hypothetical protein BJ912DRAFT_1042423 [Pholiota molesta]